MTTTKRKQVTIEEFFSIKPKKAKVIETKVKEEVTLSKADENEVKKEITEVVSTVAETRKPALDTGVKTEFESSLSTMLKDTLQLELSTIEETWFAHLSQEFKKPYFIKLKQFVNKEQATQTVFPPANDIYSWTRLTPFDDVRVVIIGQDPYHNYNQAHGLAFSVKAPTPAPPSLKNIYKELANNYKDFKSDNKIGDLTPWARQGVLMLNTALTVRAHTAASHSKQGWETFTRRALEALVEDREKEGKSLVFLCWGSNAMKITESLLGPNSNKKNIKVFKSVHPSPLSASRGFFGNNHFKAINEWLYNDRHEKMIDWSVVPGCKLQEVTDANSKL
ncbi:Uracil-DNA glycosylase [Nakaseomyces bracarensis]|uniref:Uracil-DNA glycosylase n=1 Tax=Nakaseomyces bracarensis TaxID=273131 RepID=A0ABR4P0K7_9SACH